MQPTDASAFRELVSDTLAMYGKEISVGTQRLWWAALADYEFQIVRRAFSAHITGKRGQFAPLPADVLNLIRGESGHLSAEEAWSLALESTDESATVVWTDEIAQALAAARPCLDAGDKFGARAAFVTSYEKNVRKAHPAPIWKVSAGYDAGQRQLALQSAVDSGRLSRDSVAHLLPAPEANKAIAGLLTGKVTDTAGLDPRWKALGDKLRAEQQEIATKREAERLAAAAALAERRQAMLASLEAANGH